MGQSASKESTPQEMQKESVADDRTGGSESPLQSTSTAIEAQPKQRQLNKVREGPCAQIFEDLDKCAAEKGVTKHAEKLQACPTETDRIIKCMNKNPEYFLGK